MTTTAQKTPAAVTRFNLFAEMAKIDLTKPGKSYDPVGEEEEVIGRLDEQMQRFQRVREDTVTAVSAIEKEMEDLGEEHRAMHRAGTVEDAACNSFHEKFDELGEKKRLLIDRAETLEGIIVGVLRLEYPELNERDVILREGYQLVAKKSSRQSRTTILDAEGMELMSLLALTGMLSDPSLGRRRGRRY